MGDSLSSSKHFTLQQLDSGIHAAIASDGGWAVGNAGIIDLGDHTMVFDTFVNVSPATELKEAAERATGRTVDYVVNSHAHRDHYRGNQVFTDAIIVADRKSRDEMAKRKRNESERVQIEGLDPIRSEVEEEFKYWKSNPTTTEQDKVLWDGYRDGILHGLDTYKLRVPDLSFETTMTFHGAETDAEAITYGGGHSQSDALLYLPEERIAFLGDLLFINYQPALFNGDPNELLRILDKVEALDAKTLVPGHGPVGTSKDIAPMRDYVAALEKTVEETVASGGGPERAAEKPIAAPFDSWKWHSFYKENIEFLFQRRIK